jgi:predicted dehydrogenase
MTHFDSIPMTKTLRVGLIGCRFMGKAHSNAWRQVNHFFPELPAKIELKLIGATSSPRRTLTSSISALAMTRIAP